MTGASGAGRGTAALQWMLACPRWPAQGWPLIWAEVWPAGVKSAEVQNIRMGRANKQAQPQLLGAVDALMWHCPSSLMVHKAQEQLCTLCHCGGIFLEIAHVNIDGQEVVSAKGLAM